MKTVIGAGLGQSISQQGGRFYYMEGKGEIEVKVKSGGDTRRFTLLPGKGVAMREGERFEGLEIVNLLSETQEVEFEVSDREVFDNRITGSVRVIDSNRELTGDGKTFVRPLNISGQDAGEYAHAVYVNEGTRVASVSWMTISVNAESQVFLAVAKNIDFSGPVNYSVAGGIKKGVAKNAFSAGSDLGVYRIESLSGDPNDYSEIENMFSYDLDGGALVDRPVDAPILVEPGEAIIVRAGSPGVSLLTNLEWEEYEN